MRNVVAALLFLMFPAIAHGAGYTTVPDRLPPTSLVESFGLPDLGLTEASKIRVLVPVALDLIKAYEGWALLDPGKGSGVVVAYNDAVGYCTIGYGHLIALKRCENIDIGDFASGLTPDVGISLLEGDTGRARQAVQRLVETDLTDQQFGALTSFVFNVGVENFRKSTLLKYLNDEKPDLAQKQFGRWVSAKGLVLGGLVERRSCEAALFGGTLQLDAAGHFDRSKCASLGVDTDVGSLIDIQLGEE